MVWRNGNSIQTLRHLSSLRLSLTKLRDCICLVERTLTLSGSRNWRIIKNLWRSEKSGFPVTSKSTKWDNSYLTFIVRTQTAFMKEPSMHSMMRFNTPCISARTIWVRAFTVIRLYSSQQIIMICSSTTLRTKGLKGAPTLKDKRIVWS